MQGVLDNPVAARAIGTLLCYGVGLITKKLSKRAGSVAHEWLAPALAAGAGVGYRYLTGMDPDLQNAFFDGSADGAGAVLVHSIFYGVKNRKGAGT